jgi:hypothetical protein
MLSSNRNVYLLQRRGAQTNTQYFGHVKHHISKAKFLDLKSSYILAFNNYKLCKTAQSLIDDYSITYFNTKLIIMKPSNDGQLTYSEIVKENLEELAIYLAVYSCKLCIIENIQLSKDKKTVYMRTSRFPDIIVDDELRAHALNLIYTENPDHDP